MMNLPFALLFLSLQALASGLPNIGGLTGRLESMSCKTGTYTDLDESESLYQLADQACASFEGRDYEFCVVRKIQSVTYKSEAQFFATAKENETNFEMKIKNQTGKTYFSSLRQGTHASGVDNSIMLLFNRLDVMNDPYMIETSALDESAENVAYVMIPVKTRIFKDQIYFFTDCRLNWTR